MHIAPTVYFSEHAMTTNLLRSRWIDLDSEELLFILLEMIGKPGQYSGRETNPTSFYLPLAGTDCRVKLTFADSKQLIAIDRPVVRPRTVGAGGARDRGDRADQGRARL